MEDRGIAREIGEWLFLRDAFKYQHRKRVCVGIGLCRDGTPAEELGGGIPQSVSGHPRRGHAFVDLVRDSRYSEIANLWFTLSSVWSALS